MGACRGALGAWTSAHTPRWVRVVGWALGPHWAECFWEQGPASFLDSLVLAQPHHPVSCPLAFY